MSQSPYSNELDIWLTLKYYFKEEQNKDQNVKNGWNIHYTPF